MLVDVARQTAADNGREPSDVEVTASHLGLFGDDPHSAVEELRSWGVDRVVLPSFLYRRDTGEKLAELGESLIAAHPD